MFCSNYITATSIKKVSHLTSWKLSKKDDEVSNFLKFLTTNGIRTCMYSGDSFCKTDK